MDKKWKNKNFLEALKNAINGIKLTIKSELNIKIQLVFTAIALVFSAIFRVNCTEALFIISAIFLVLILELVNTAIENTVDLVTEEYNEKAKCAKDIASRSSMACKYIFTYYCRNYIYSQNNRIVK